MQYWEELVMIRLAHLALYSLLVTFLSFSAKPRIVATINIRLQQFLIDRSPAAGGSDLAEFYFSLRDDPFFCHRPFPKHYFYRIFATISADRMKRGQIHDNKIVLESCKFDAILIRTREDSVRSHSLLPRFWSQNPVFLHFFSPHHLA